ncbi:OprD family porin [Sulfurovum sp. bin170]|uniref:OprD family outer membrane porin n=1 Tax=Sulfurovum sp. bin170 TaxID=2695268 RepID=UPI0013DFE95F|nr:OprD family outer membrane porin [Sulfurovum sp. bin170]NEW61242.1 OprD family porin [Sulfurovum sp. bin170]
MRKVTLSLVALTAMSIGAENLKEVFSNVLTEGQVRLGVVQIEDEVGGTASTASLGGSLGVKTDPLKGISLGAKFYTTNALFGKDNEGMFLDSNNDSYSIVGEAYIQADLGKTTIKAGRQVVDTPYANSDDIGMVPNTFEGYTLVNQDITDTTVILASLDKWSGVDTDTPEKFNNLQDSSDAVLMASVIYEGIDNTTLQAWHYRLDDTNFNYVEAGYETEQFNLALQYTDQDNDNMAFGLSAGVNFGDLALVSAYNKVDGMVSNGFGGGPFFTSSEDHTVADAIDQEAILVGAEYSIAKATLALTHVAFDKSEDETDYLLSYAVNDNHSLDLIYSDMYDDGKMVRFFANYSF